MLRNDLIREEPIGARAHGDAGEELHVSTFRTGPASPTMIELRQWNFKSSGKLGPTSHGLQIPVDLAAWLAVVLMQLAEENESGERPEYQEVKHD